MNDLDKYIRELETLLDESWTLPIAKNKYIVDGEKLLSIVDHIKKSYPVEITQAKDVLSKRDQIEERARKDSEEMRQQAAKYSEETLLKARRNKERILSEAEEAAKAKIDDQEIMAAAQKQAAMIIQKAKDDSVRMKNVTMDYLRRALDESHRSLEKANEMIDSLRSAYNGEDKE